MPTLPAMSSLDNPSSSFAALSITIRIFVDVLSRSLGVTMPRHSHIQSTSVPSPFSLGFLISASIKRLISTYMYANI